MLTLIIEMGMANQYSLDLSKNVKRGNKTKIEKGGFCGKAPLGNKNCKETKSVIKEPLMFDKVKQFASKTWNKVTSFFKKSVNNMLKFMGLIPVIKLKSKIRF